MPTTFGYSSAIDVDDQKRKVYYVNDIYAIHK